MNIKRKIIAVLMCFVLVTFSFSNVVIANQNEDSTPSITATISNEVTTEAQIKIHFQKPTTWNNAKIYYYDQAGNKGAEWPGESMSSGSDGWYTYTINNLSQAKVIFNDGGSNQVPTKDQQGFDVRGEMWYRDGAWYHTEPENITIHFYKPSDWQSANIYYYKSTIDTEAAWPGEAMTSEGDGWYSYEISKYDTVKVIFNDGKGNQIPSKNTPGFDVTGQKWYKDGQWYNKKPEEKAIKLHFHKPEAWGKVNAYYYQTTTQTGPAWPGEQMSSEGDGWYNLEITKFSDAKVLFNDGGSNQIPAKNQEGFNVTEEMWYRNGTWYTEKPSGIIVHYYKPDNWGAPNIYYYATTQDTGPAWPGEAMTAEEDNWYVFNINKYSEAKVLFNDGNYQLPARLIDGFEVQGEKWYKDGTWYDKNPDGEIDYEKDTDKDGLPDYFEKIIDTKIDKVDTDEDGLPDGYEYYYLGTDPTRRDTDKNGIDDNQEDFDNDQLFNLKEYERNTDPYVADTDEDGLLDGDEVHTYNTNPLSEDTDGDTLLDKEEINIGLDPNNTHTFGILDSEYIIKQTIKADSLTNIEQKAYTLSAEVEAAGDANTYFDVRDSVYSNILASNDAILGNPIELVYERDVDNIKLMFQPEEIYLNSAIGTYSDVEGMRGVNRYQVFKYDETSNILYPILTNHDEETNMVYAETKELGTYCIIDLEKWFYSLGISPNTDDESMILDTYSINELSVGTNQKEMENLSNNIVKKSVNTPVELVFIVDITGSMDEKIEPLKSKISSLVEELYRKGLTLKVAAVTYNNCFDTKVVVLPRYNEFVNATWGPRADVATRLINQIQKGYGGDEPYIDGIATALKGLTYDPNSKKFFVVITDEEGSTSNRDGYGVESLAFKLVQEKISTSFVTDPIYYNHRNYKPIYTQTNGICTSLEGDYITDIQKWILVSSLNTKNFTVVNPANLKAIVLSESPKKGSLVNSDSDKLTDSEEIDWKTIEGYWGNESLPTLGSYLAKMHTNYGDIYKRIGDKYINKLNSIVVLPILSDPTSADSDGDTILDHDEDEKDRMIYNPIKIQSGESITTSIRKNGYCLIQLDNNNLTDLYDLYTTGTSDTYGELFYMSLGKYIRLAVDDNSGDGKNFEIQSSLKAFNKYYLKITNNHNASSTFGVNMKLYLDKKLNPEGGSWLPERNLLADSRVDSIVYMPVQRAREYFNIIDQDIYRKIRQLSIQIGITASIWYLTGIASDEVGDIAMKYGLPKKWVGEGANLLITLLTLNVSPNTIALEKEDIEKATNNFSNGIRIVTTSSKTPQGIFVQIRSYSPWLNDVMEGREGMRGTFKDGDYGPLWNSRYVERE